MIISFLGGNTPPVIFKRSMISFLLFGILGYVAGWIIHRVAQPKLAFIEEDDEEEDIEDGEAMESL